jgi:transposase InsO family protein
MPWQETRKMDQRMEFVLKAVNAANFRELCREYGISAKTGYKWRERFMAWGFAGLNEESRRPRSHADALDSDIVCEIVRLKQAHRHWGPRKIHALYERRHGAEGAPSESSFKRVLERAGLTEKRRLRRAGETGGVASGVKAGRPNDVWSVDFKGWWRDADGLRVEPLTVRDEFSRMILEVRALEDARTESVRVCFERLFAAHGLPGAIRSDNGTPFASAQGLLGLSRLSVWWLALGINLERSRPGCPQDNGAHERMHKDIRGELEAGRAGRDQAAFEVWRQEFNNERPHESLGMRVPAEVYEPSPRAYEGTPQDVDYGSMQSRRISPVGCACYQGAVYQISTALKGWSVGMKPIKDGMVEVWFSKLLLGYIDPTTESFAPVRTDGRKAQKTEAPKCNP